MAMMLQVLLHLRLANLVSVHNGRPRAPFAALKYRLDPPAQARTLFMLALRLSWQC